LAISDALLRARTVLAEKFNKLDNQAYQAARADKGARLLATRFEPAGVVQECGTAVRPDLWHGNRSLIPPGCSG
jgi:hypothetical protein